MPSPTRDDGKLFINTFPEPLIIQPEQPQQLQITVSPNLEDGEDVVNTSSEPFTTVPIAPS